MLFTLPSRSKQAYYWLQMLVTLFSLINITVAFCPIKCHCDDSILLADCTGGSLDLVPITLNPQLRELHLASNQIRSIKETLSFYNNLLLLDLNDNQLQTLGERNFNQLRTLKILKISSNRLSQLNNQTFAGLFNLQQLYLPHNELRTVHNDVFKNLNRLRLLDLSHNALINLQNNVFANLATLEMLNLAHNRFDNKISTLIFDRLTTLKILHLDHNSLQQLPDYLFRALTQLHTLTLNHCELQTLNRNLFFGLESLKHLKLSHNQFNQLPIDVFNSLENLEKLELQGTALLQLPNIFTPLKSIKHLSLGYDRFLKQITSDLFNQNAKLQSIAIEHCPSLEQLPIGLFNAQRQLLLINLAQNALSTLQPNTFSNYTLLLKLILTGNPLNCDCNLAWLYSLPALRTDKLIASSLIKKLSISIEDGDELERVVEKWNGKEEDLNFINKHDKSVQTNYKHHHKNSNSNNIKHQHHQHHLKSNHQNEIDFNSAEYQDHFNNHFKQQQQNNALIDQQTDHYLKDYLKDQTEHQIQTSSSNNNEIIATCFEPLSLVGRPLLDLTAIELNCNHQSIMINGEKINFENRNSEMVIGYDEQQQYAINNRDQFNSDDYLNNSSNSSSGLLNSSFTLCFASVFAICLILFIMLFGFIYLRRHRKEHHQPISSWILKTGASNNATLSFQPFASFDMNQEHLNQQTPKCNTLVNPLAKLGPLPKKPPLNNPLINQNNLLMQNNLNNQLNLSPNLSSSNYNSNSTLNSKLKLTPQITRISNLTPNNCDLASKLYEQIDYTGFEQQQEQIYEDPLVDDLNNLNIANNYGYQQLNSTTSTSSSYLSNGLNIPTTYEEFLATALMRSTPNSYGTLNGNLNGSLNSQATTNRLLNTSNLNNLNINNINSINNNINNMNSNRTTANSNSRRTLNTMAHL